MYNFEVEGLYFLVKCTPIIFVLFIIIIILYMFLLQLISLVLKSNNIFIYIYTFKWLHYVHSHGPLA